MHFRMSPKITALAAWLAAVAFFGGFAGSHVMPQLVGLYDLSRSNRVALGEVIEVYPQNHSTCKYRFLLDGRSYENVSRSCGNDRVGQQVKIYFSPADPTKSINGYARNVFLNDLIPFVAALVLFPIFAALGVYAKLSGKRRI
jgi:hypothetical protein